MTDKNLRVKLTKLDFSNMSMESEDFGDIQNEENFKIKRKSLSSENLNEEINTPHKIFRKRILLTYKDSSDSSSEISEIKIPEVSSSSYDSDSSEDSEYVREQEREVLKEKQEAEKQDRKLLAKIVEQTTPKKSLRKVPSTPDLNIIPTFKISEAAN